MPENRVQDRRLLAPALDRKVASSSPVEGEDFSPRLFILALNSKIFRVPILFTDGLFTMYLCEKCIVNDGNMSGPFPFRKYIKEKRYI